MYINEIFKSIQGEGFNGYPAVFIRFSGCSLNCSYCDSKYHTKRRELNKKDEKLLKKEKVWIITGGEPMLQQNNILELIEKYKPKHVVIETNGTLKIKKRLVLLLEVVFSVSPKEKRFQLQNSNSVEPIILTQFKEDGSFYVKFVYSDKKSRRFIKKIIKKYNIPNYSVYIMPEGKTIKELKEKQKEVWSYCIKNDFNYSPRLHIEIWGNKKGV